MQENSCESSKYKLCACNKGIAFNKEVPNDASE